MFDELTNLRFDKIANKQMNKITMYKSHSMVAQWFTITLKMLFPSVRGLASGDDDIRADIINGELINRVACRVYFGLLFCFVFSNLLWVWIWMQGVCQCWLHEDAYYSMSSGCVNEWFIQHCNCHYHSITVEKMPTCCIL